ncbi:MAG: hypothetical protein PHG13_01240 [Candidatus Pacebacteria bacterium]|nr:hypothetical protein [Candidatus Paceibacterota bacterium]MDD5721919.1 hypothetical protein [Candidatus Paceibacterota bacterium]
MKIKNVFKIGIFGTILLFLLISPVFKFNNLQASAYSCTEAGGTCRPGCNDDEKFESRLTCTGSFLNTNCCVPEKFNYESWVDQQKLKSKSACEQAGYICRIACLPGEEIVQGAELCGPVRNIPRMCCMNIATDKFHREGYVEDVVGTAQESNAAKICNALFYGDENPKNRFAEIFGWLSDKNANDTWWAHKACLVQIGAIEGLGKMIGGMINTLTGNILWALNPDTYGGFVKNPGVVAIWSILRNFMNLALVLILIIIAIATILGIKKYRWQDILWKLIVIALLINFSLILPGILLDLSQFTTYVFLNLAQEATGQKDIAQAIMDNFATNEISGVKKYNFAYDDKAEIKTITVEGQDIKMSTKGWGLSWGNFLLIIAALGIIGLFVFISLIAIFFVMVARSFLIIILLAVSPIAFAAWVLPNTEKFWNLWWGQFSRWCLFPITFAVSLYAGLVVVSEMNVFLANLGAQEEKLGIITMIIQIVLFSMFLIGGLIVSIQSSGAVGKVVQKQVSRAGWLAGAFVGAKTIKGIKETGMYKKAGEALTHVPLLKGVGQEMLVTGEKAKATRVKEYEKGLENISLGSLKQLEKAPLPSSLDKNAYEKRIALVNKLAEMGELGDESTKFINLHKDDIRFNKKAITEAIPHEFRVEGGRLINTPDSIEEKVTTLTSLKPDKLKDKTQLKDFVEKTIDKEYQKSIEQGAWLPHETEKAMEEAYDKVFQSLVKKFSASQMAAFWKGLGPKYFDEEKQKLFIESIKRDPATLAKFNKHIKDSRALREESGIDLENTSDASTWDNIFKEE